VGIAAPKIRLGGLKLAEKFIFKKLSDSKGRKTNPIKKIKYKNSE